MASPSLDDEIDIEGIAVGRIARLSELERPATVVDDHPALHEHRVALAYLQPPRVVRTLPCRRISLEKLSRLLARRCVGGSATKVPRPGARNKRPSCTRRCIA